MESSGSYQVDGCVRFQKFDLQLCLFEEVTVQASGFDN